MPLALHLIALLVLFMLSAFFSSAETAIFSLSKIEKRRMVSRHPHLSKWVVFHMEHPRLSLISILIGNLIVNTLAAATATIIALKFFGGKNLSLVLTLFTVLLILFAEILPKTVAVRKNETISAIAAWPLYVFTILIFPLRWLVRGATDFILGFLIPERKEHSDEISQDELKTLVKIGEEEGVLDSQERYMLQKILELGERQVKDIMTPRIDVAGLDIEDPREKHLAVIQKHHFAHLPVYKGTIDHILGIISIQEYVLKSQVDIMTLLKQPLFVPQSKRIDDLLAELRGKNEKYAVCVDEYGGTAGIVTLEDIFEEIFGEFYDEYAKVENPIRPLGHEEFIVEAKIPLSEFNEYFSTEMKAEEASTLGGFILEKLGSVPEKGRVLETPEFMIRVHDVIGQRRIRSVTVRRRK